MAKEKFVVAIKETPPGKPIRPGKVLGEFRKKEFADKGFHSLVKAEGTDSWRVGIFQNGKLVS